MQSDGTACARPRCSVRRWCAGARGRTWGRSASAAPASTRPSARGRRGRAPRRSAAAAPPCRRCARSADCRRGGPSPRRWRPRPPGSARPRPARTPSRWGCPPACPRGSGLPLHEWRHRPASIRGCSRKSPSSNQFSFSSRAVCSARVSASMISSRSPFMMSSILYRVRPMRWSVTRPWGKL